MSLYTLSTRIHTAHLREGSVYNVLGRPSILYGAPMYITAYLTGSVYTRTPPLQSLLCTPESQWQSRGNVSHREGCAGVRWVSPRPVQQRPEIRAGGATGGHSPVMWLGGWMVKLTFLSFELTFLSFGGVE